MTTPSGGAALRTDFELMRHVAGQTERRNEEIGALLRTFIGRMTAVPSSVWGGAAAVTFRSVVERWNSESVKLQQSLAAIAETIRANERALADSGDSHAHRIGAAGAGL